MVSRRQQIVAVVGDQDILLDAEDTGNATLVIPGWILRIARSNAVLFMAHACLRHSIS